MSAVDTASREAAGEGQGRASAARPPDMPADWGLTPLGLLMELGGLLSLVVGGLFIMIGMMASLVEGAAGLLFALFGASAIVRSELHRRAGRGLIYGNPRGAMRPLKVYIAFALVHSLVAPALVLPLASDAFAATSMAKTGIALFVWLACWPAAVMLLARRTPFWRRENDAEALPASEDNGYEGLAVLMTVFGSFGAVIACAAAFSMIASGVGGHLLVGIPLAGLLAYRAARHLGVGIAGVRGVGGSEFEERGMRYSNAAIVIAFLVSAATLLAFVMLSAEASPHAIVFPFALFWLLFVWPRIVGQFLNTRGFAQLMGGGSPLSRSPDLALTALGWLLLAAGVLPLAGAATSLLGLSYSDLGGFDAAGFAMDTQGGSPLPQLVAGAAQVWAGAELVGMTRRCRRAALVYGAVGISTAIYEGWDHLVLMSDLGVSSLTPSGALPAMGALLVFVPMLILPIATIALTRRRGAQEARVVSGA